MKKLILLFLFLPVISQAQEFSFELYFEDALGNRDTLVLGYDPLATDSIDVAFGEENIISQPWDSVFEVRVGDKRFSESSPNISTPNTFLSKKQILASYCETTRLASHYFTFQIQTDNYPVKVFWDKSLFQDTCLTFSLFYGMKHAYDLDVGGIHSFLKWQDSLMILPTPASSQNYYVYNTADVPEYELSQYVSGDKMIVCLGMVFYKETYLSVAENSLSDFLLSPNPVNSNEKLNVSISGNYSILDNSGKMIQIGKVDNGAVQLNNLESGIYFFILENENAVQKTKFVVR